MKSAGPACLLAMAAVVHGIVVAAESPEWDADAAMGKPTRWVAMRLRPGWEATGEGGLESLARRAGALRVLPVGTLVHVRQVDAGDEPGQVHAVVRRLMEEPSVESAWPLRAFPRSHRALPNDPYLSRQWGLNNTRQSGGVAGADVRAFGAWQAGFTGSGVLVSVVDDGFEQRHPDLQANLRRDLGWDYRANDADAEAEGGDGFDETGSPRADAHGTAVAGIVAAVGNNGLGVAGVAWGARVVPVRALQRDMTDAQEAGALSHRADVVSVSNNSWGPDDDAKAIVSPGPLAEEARLDGIQRGRGGRGVIYVWAAGNGGEEDDDANYDGYANSPQVIAVGALTDRGERCAYSEKGACLCVSAPAGRDGVRNPGTWTTDLSANRGYNSSSVTGELSDRRFTSNFNGTSAAAPMVSGVVALMLEANPTLGWRDVKEVLMRSASWTDAANAGWFTNGAGLRFNHAYGAGRVNAEAAVRMAQSWTNLPPEEWVGWPVVDRVPVPIPDGDAAGVALPVQVSSDLRVETARLALDIEHPGRNELQVELISPHGTVSRLWSPHDDRTAHLRHRFTSVFCWGEPADGTWRVRVADLTPGQSGHVVSARLELSGSLPQVRLSGAIDATGRFVVQLDGKPGSRGRIQASRDLRDWTDVADVVLVDGTGLFSEAVPGDGPRWFRWRGDARGE